MTDLPDNLNPEKIHRPTRQRRQYPTSFRPTRAGNQPPTGEKEITQ
jgi:hypothetical protein